MGLFEDVVINAKSAVDVVGKEAGRIVDISKLRINAADLNNEINKRFESLGRVVYDGRKTENESADLVAECVTAIDELYEQLDAVNDQLLQLSKKTACKVCGEENSQGSNYCNKCGANLNEKPAEKPAENPEEEPKV